MNRLILIAPVALTLATPALAGPLGHGHRGEHRSPEKMLERAEHVMDEVDATDDQKSMVRSILDDALPTLQSFHTEAGQLREEIRGVFTADTIDRGALEDARLDMVDLVDRASSFFFTTLADVAEVFTPEQRTELQELRTERRSRWMKRHGERTGR